VKPKNVQRDLVHWRGIWNLEARIIRIDELTEPSFEKDKANGTDKKHGHDNKSSVGSNNKDRNTDQKKKSTFRKTNNKKGRRVKVMRQTFTENTRIPETSVTISMKDSEDSIDGDGNDDNDSTSGQDEKSTKKKTPARKKKKQKKACQNPISRHGCTRIDKLRAIINPGTKLDFIGGVGWKVLSKVDNQVAQLDGALEGMGKCSLLLVTAVTAHDHPMEGTILLGAGCAGWDERPQQTKSLFNSHNMRKHNVIVHDTAKPDGGLQRLEVDGFHIPLDFVDDKTLSLQLRQPAPEELEKLEILWLTPRKLTANSNIHCTARRAPGGIVPVPAPWEERLGYAPELITVKTLKGTRQLCSSPVEMDQRENPRQHRKTRIQALHPRRITGRTGSDTFFSSVESVRKYMSVQIFFCVLKKFLYVKGTRRELHSHGMYQEFVRDVGAPNKLLRDNSQTQTGKKWTKTSRETSRNKFNRFHTTKAKTKPNKKFGTSRKEQS
jgi:hypothetical protein